MELATSFVISIGRAYGLPHLPPPPPFFFPMSLWPCGPCPTRLFKPPPLLLITSPDTPFVTPQGFLHGAGNFVRDQYRQCLRPAPVHHTDDRWCNSRRWCG